MHLATGVAYVDGRVRVGRQALAQVAARTNDVHRPAAGKGRGGGMAHGLRQVAKPQSSVVRLWLVILINSM